MIETFKEIKDISDGKFSDCPLAKKLSNFESDSSIQDYDESVARLGQKNDDISDVPKVSMYESDIKNEIDESKTGGSYGEIFKGGIGDKYEIHHMPADSASPLDRNDGPAIKMEKEDHRQTASCGSSREAREYREKQKELIDNGKFCEAVQMDIDDIRSKFGNKYDDAISQMCDYINKLESEGKING